MNIEDRFFGEFTAIKFYTNCSSGNRAYSADRWTNRRADVEADGQTDGEKNRHTARQTHMTKLTGAFVTRLKSLKWPVITVQSK